MADDYNAAAKAMRDEHGGQVLREIERRIADHRRGGDAEIIECWIEVRQAYLRLRRR